MPKETRMEAKKQIVAELAKRTGIDSAKVNRFVQQWALTAHDEDMQSLAIHRDAAELFGMKLPDYTSRKIAEVEEDLENIIREFQERSLTYSGATRGEVLAALREQSLYSKYFQLMPSQEQKALLRAMKDHTREQMALLGYGPDDTIRLRRGVGIPRTDTSGWSVGDEVPIEGNTLGSWSIHYETAEDFAYSAGRGDMNGVVFEMDVPVDMLVGSSRTGFGCLVEGEFVVQGGFGNAKVAWMKR
jgi:hypothetical protein